MLMVVQRRHLTSALPILWSAGRGAAKGLHARYWSFLFENLRRAVDEIYQTCETDDSVLECKETIMILERCTQDFRNLIEWMKIKWEYDHTPKPQRPASVAWEIRKTSPGKLPLALVEKKLIGDQSRRQLAFEDRSTADAATCTDLQAAGDPDGAVGRYLEHALRSAIDATAAAGADAGVDTCADAGADSRTGIQRSVTICTDRPPAPAQLYSSCVKSHSNSSLSSTTSSSGHSWADREGQGEARREAKPVRLEIGRSDATSGAAKREVAGTLAPSVAPAAPPADPAIHSSVPCLRSPSPPTSSPPTSASQSPPVLAVPPPAATSATPASASAAADGAGRDLASPVTPRDLTSPELDEDSVDEEMVMAEKALQSAIVEERQLEQQLAETEKCVIEVDTETDGDSTSIDTECEGDGDEESGRTAPTPRSLIEDQYAPELEGLSWGDRMDMLEELEDISSRKPGRGLQMHEKLSSPSRKKALSETIRLHQERQKKASHMRQTLMEQKTQKLSEISIKIEEVRQQKEQLLERRRLMLERKMSRAEEKRKKHLQGIVRRAHDEEEKAKEIAFINEMEAKNKRHEFLSQIQTQEARLAGIQEERQRRVEEKAAKEAAVEEKRRALEQERRVKLEELKQKRQERLERIHREQQDKEKERQEMAREKQRDRDERISALHAAQQATAEELQKRIQQKQEESARRHEENMVQIRQKALELSVRSAAAGSDDTGAQLAPYDTKKMCTLCNVLIGSEVYLLSHLRGRQHQESVRAAAGADLAGEELLTYNLRHITDAAPQHIMNMTFDKERHKTLRKRCKKIKARMVARQEEFAKSSQVRQPPVDSPHRAKLTKCVKELNKTVSGQGRGPWPNAAVSALDRTLGEMTRVLEKGIRGRPDDPVRQRRPGRALRHHLRDRAGAGTRRRDRAGPDGGQRQPGAGGRLSGPRGQLPAPGQQQHGGRRPRLADDQAHPAVVHVRGRRRVHCDPGAAALMQLTSAVLAALTRSDLSHQRWGVLQDVCSYLVCVGTVDKMASFFSCVQGGPDLDPHLSDFLVQSLRLLRTMAALLTSRYPQSTQRKDALDRTGLIATLQVTQLAGIVSMLYSVLLRQHSPAQRGQTPPPRLDDAALRLATEGLATLLQLAQLDLHMFQLCLGFDGRSVEFRHVTSYLLWYCSHHERPDLLHLVIQSTGYFAVRCYDNQMVIQKGNMPTVLQQLLTLPFSYFSDPTLTAVLFPTLLACSFDNAQTRAILQEELSFQILEDFLKHESSRSCHLVRVLLTTDEEGGSARSDCASIRSASVASS
ncbi:LOW QUALITY PROTEIN: S phase cyclin A-associated protein in the endoplasmic reticulum-like [Pollicipes pollicipes]|uniref:LOW QUALITY PROTEIN: S phase cyclin A-associated protein in the endoplasmic reticulum-like n=1 Tax=Pollicipes pollicipes TaxID=41117 RepID=UPI0018852C4C|nr:LOW QUALITY PROTEIN: S phase cyclin A-associated protein in the endoplasmic reticulum-like [Pollicipes pollicipes]